MVLHADASPEEYAQHETTELLVSALAENGNATHIAAYRQDNEQLSLIELLNDGKVPAGAQWFLCGGNGFLQDIRDQLEAGKQDLVPTSIHFELFSPNDWLIN